MSQPDSLRQLLLDFFNLAPGTAVEDLNQKSVAAWDSLAMVQLITELQSMYQIQFELEEIEQLGSYEMIRTALVRKGVNL